ncbi:unnamed protein product [Adineta steineri]|uniref:Intersectin-1 n=1 Tax=Adineta steineri TaxID=433720 RepID=A0A815QJD6_9BILA|nr:unnamed protein product [Adineta steineri]
MASNWRISPDERVRYEAYFQQCGPVQGYLTGEQAREFFVKSNLPGDILRKIWDLADVTSDGRLDKREFAIACCLISSQVQKTAPLPPTLPSSLLSDLGAVPNGVPPASFNPANQPVIPDQLPGHVVKAADPNNIPIVPLTPIIRSKYIQQFHSIVDVTKTNGFMTGLQAKTILQQTGLSNVLLHQIWNLADHDKDGRLTPDEFVVAMHCCDIVRTGQTLPSRLPDEWLPTNQMQRERIDSSSSAKSNGNPSYAILNQQLKETFNVAKPAENVSATPAAEPTEAERKLAAVTYEEKRIKNYEDGNRELERRRQALRELEEREQKEREERERKRELELQKHKEEQERKKQVEIERQLEKQRQIEQQKEEERKKLMEQREAARKEMERKSRLEWERQRMQELSAQKSRLLEQINDLKSRETGHGLELESMDDTMQTCQTKINQTEINIHTIDESIAEIQRNISTEKNLYENIEQQKKDLTTQLNSILAERESLDSSVNQLIQSKEFSMGNREADQIQYLQTQIENMNQENIQVDEQIITMTDQSKEYQTQMEELRLQFNQLEQEAKDKKPPSKVTTPTSPPAEFANFDQFNATQPSDEINNQPSHLYPSLPVEPTTTSPPPSLPPTVDVDPFQTVDPFASQPDIDSTTANNDWFQPSTDITNSTTVDPFLPKPEPTDITNSAAVDPFLPKPEPTENIPVVVAAAASPRMKKAAPKANPNLKDVQKQTSVTVAADPWGASATTNDNGGNWAQFDATNKASSPFGTNDEWPQTTNISNENSTMETIHYRVLYDYASERPDEMAISANDIILVDPTKQQDDHWLFGQIGNDRQGFFPAAYAERITSTPATNTVDTVSQLSAGSWVITLAEYQGKTVDKHLSFQKDELILVREQKDAIWYSGQLQDKIGWFPRNYVRPATEAEIETKKNSTEITPTNEKTLNSPTSNKNEVSNDIDNADIYEAVYAYEATDASDLSFDIGDRIIVLERDGDWWTGQIGDRKGAFPSNYVQKVENIQEETAIALKPFEATEEDRLSFEQGQMIYIIKKDDNGWYQGEIRLPDQPVRVGWFPAECVQVPEATATELPVLSPQQDTTGIQQYIAIFPYEAQQDDELSFPADAVLEILDPENTSGWFKARLGEQTGLIPSTYIQPIGVHSQSAPTPCYLSPNIIPCTPTLANSSRQLYCDDTTISSMNDSSTLITDTSSSHQTVTNSSRIAAIRELIETERRYVNDLCTVANEFIKPLSNGRILSDYEIEQLFSNWFSLIACNSVFLSTLQDLVQFREHVLILDESESMRTPRSASMSNIAMIANAPMQFFVEIQHLSLDRQGSHSQSMQRLKSRTDLYRRHRAPSNNNLTSKRSRTIERLDDNIVPQATHSTSYMTINESTRIGDVLCSYLPYMADAYFQYCNRHSQANKYLQSKMTLNKEFSTYLKIFQYKTGGLSLNGFLTKPIQRVTRYPLLIEKILKHTPINHPDYKFIQKAFDCARQLNERIDTQICEQENSLRLNWLQQHFIFHTDEDSSADGYIFDELVKFNSRTKYHTQRQLLLHGFIVKMPSGRELLVFLFNDFLLFATMKSSSSHWQSQLFERKSNLQLKLYRTPIFLTDIIIVNESLTDQLTFSIATKIFEKPIILKTQQNNIRTLWVRTINNAVEELKTIEKSIISNKALFSITREDGDYNPKSAIARLILVVQEAHDVVPSIPTLERARTLKSYCEITIGSLSSRTPSAKGTANPKWNVPMQFFIYDLVEDIIHINLFDNKYFSPDENIGFTSMHLIDILPCSLDTFLAQPPAAFTQTIYLNNGSSLTLKCLIQFLV